MTALRMGIVGASGQVGSALLKALNNDCEISAIGICRSNVSAARIAAQGLPVRIVQTDNAVELCERTRDLDVLVNCALPQYATSKTSAASKNLAQSLVTACAGKHLVHLSSVAVYGDFIPGSRTFFDHPNPDTNYGRQKLQMEQLLRKPAKKHNMRCTILRVGHVYGSELRWSEAIFDFIKRGSFRLPFDGQIHSNAVSAKNLFAGIRKVVLSEPAEATLNLTDSPQSTWRAIFDLHSLACGSPLVRPLDRLESERRSLEARNRGQTSLLTRLAHETMTWITHLPASYIASAPAFKAMLQIAIAQMGSERLDAKLWAFYWRHLAPRIQLNSGPMILPIFFSDPAPGPSLIYQGCALDENIEALRDWHDAIAAPSCPSVRRSPYLPHPHNHIGEPAVLIEPR